MSQTTNTSDLISTWNETQAGKLCLARGTGGKSRMYLEALHSEVENPHMDLPVRKRGELSTTGVWLCEIIHIDLNKDKKPVLWVKPIKNLGKALKNSYHTWEYLWASGMFATTFTAMNFPTKNFANLKAAETFIQTNSTKEVIEDYFEEAVNLFKQEGTAFIYQFEKVLNGTSVYHDLVLTLLTNPYKFKEKYPYIVHQFSTWKQEAFKQHRDIRVDVAIAVIELMVEISKGNPKNFVQVLKTVDNFCKEHENKGNLWDIQLLLEMRGE